jgi:preprotein translocase subunit SecA
VLAIDEQMQAPREMHFEHAQPWDPLDDHDESQLAEAEKVPEHPFVRAAHKVGRNELCPCGSGKKYKQCHGKLS